MDDAVTTWLQTSLPCDVGHLFDVDGGGYLQVLPGAIPCRVGLGPVENDRPGHPLAAEMSGWEQNAWIHVTLEITDRHGGTYRCWQLVPASTFVCLSTQATAVPAPIAAAQDRAVPACARLVSFFDRDQEFIMRGSCHDVDAAFAYGLRNSAAHIELRVLADASGDALEISLQPVRGQGRDGADTLPVRVRTALIAAFVLWPQLVEDQVWPVPAYFPLFERTATTGTPCAQVSWIPGAPSEGASQSGHLADPRLLLNAEPRGTRKWSLVLPRHLLPDEQ